MEKEFVPYELAVKLKELGFDEECLGWYTVMENLVIKKGVKLQDLWEENILAPLWQQAFDWFREKHNLHYILHKSFDGYFIDIIQLTNFASELYE